MNREAYMYSTRLAKFNKSHDTLKSRKEKEISFDH